jgi:HSP20 family protein
MMNRLPKLLDDAGFESLGLPNLIDHFFRDFDRIGLESFSGYGRADVYERDGALVYETELPGMKKSDLEVKIQDDRLVISGEIKRDESIHRESYFRMGRRYGRFQRAFPIPTENLETHKVKAQFEDGILRVSIPLKESIVEKRKPLEIKVD